MLYLLQGCKWGAGMDRDHLPAPVLLIFEVISGV
jgi:hypothetical protein